MAAAALTLAPTIPAISNRVRLSAALPALMALVAIGAVVNVPRHVVVLEVVCVVTAVASGALEDGVVIRTGVACRADTVRIAMGHRELRVLRMVERRPGPRRRVVARLARGREELRLRRVSRIRRVVVVGLVAADTGRGQRRVVVVDVTIGAHTRGNRVRTGQGKGSVVVIESRIGPDRRVVAHFARRRVSRGRVNGTRRAVVIFLVARVTQCAVQGIVVVGVAIGTLPRRHRMRSRQLESCARVIERPVGPEHCIVAGFTGGGETRSNMVHRRGGVVVVGLMAGYARRIREVVIVVHVAIGALPWRRRVRSGQRESRAVVIKRRIQPGARVVALVASLGEVRRYVIRVRCSLVILQVT